MALMLRDDLFFCLTDRCAIFLDLAANRYFGLTGSADLAFRRIIAGDGLDPRLERALRPLLAKGLMIPTDRAIVLAPVKIAEPASSMSGVVARSPLGTIVTALGHRVRIAIEMRLAGLKAMVRKRQERKALNSPSNAASGISPAIEQVVAAHQRVDDLIGGANHCLVRSLAMIDHLAGQGYYPELVIGIRTGAFSAHCWVQSGTTVLNDAVDRVRLFTPIMVL